KIREKGKKLISKIDDDVETNDKDYVFIHFILNNLPRGLVGLLLAVNLSAAMSSTASEHNSLASTTVVDLYQHNQTEVRLDEHYPTASKWFTFGWGMVALLVVCTANLFDNLIQLDNLSGSMFHGNVLRIFLIASFITYIKRRAVFTAAII